MKPVDQAPLFPLRKEPQRHQPGPLKTSCPPLPGLSESDRSRPSLKASYLPPAPTCWLPKPQQSFCLEEAFLEHGITSKKPSCLTPLWFKAVNPFRRQPFPAAGSGELRAGHLAASSAHRLNFHTGNFLTLVFTSGFPGE